MARRTLSPSAFALCLVFGVTAYAGADVVGFFALTQRIWFGPADQPTRGVLEEVSAWTNTSSVETAARSLLLEVTLVEAKDDKAAIEGALDELAAASPTSSATWLALAEIRKTRGAPMESVLAAFRMSVLTGSHEGHFMMRRAIFGLAHWGELPQQDRQTVIRDLLGSIAPENWEAEGRYRKILAAKPKAERDSIRDALLGSGLATKSRLTALGV
jgi:hypothetical protein